MQHTTQALASSTNTTILEHASSSTIAVYEATTPPTPAPSYSVAITVDAAQVSEPIVVFLLDLSATITTTTTSFCGTTCSCIVDIKHVATIV